MNIKTGVKDKIINNIIIKNHIYQLIGSTEVNNNFRYYINNIPKIKTFDDFCIIYKII